MAQTATLYEQLIDRIDLDLMRDIQSRYPVHRLRKYFDVPTQCRLAVERVEDLGLSNCEPKRILDIGTAFGYFPAACSLAGHIGIGLDEPMGVISEVTYAVEFFYQPHLVRKYAKLPDIGRADIITAYGVNFGYHDANYWGWPEYEFFARDLIDRLNPGGRIVFRFNRGPNTDFLCDQNKWREITGCNCTLNGLKLEILP